MTAINLNEEPEEIRQLIEGHIKELLKIRSSKRTLDEQDRQIRDQLIATLDNMGLEAGDAIEAPELSSAAALRRHTISRLDAEKLLAQGVPADLIEKATQRNQTKLFVTIMENKPPQNKNGGTNSRSEGK